MDEVKIINKHKRFHKTGAKTGAKANAGSKKIRSLVSENHSFVSERWKKIKEEGMKQKK